MREAKIFLLLIKLLSKMAGNGLAFCWLELELHLPELLLIENMLMKLSTKAD